MMPKNLAPVISLLLLTIEWRYVHCAKNLKLSAPPSTQNLGLILKTYATLRTKIHSHQMVEPQDLDDMKKITHGLNKELESLGSAYNNDLITKGNLEDSYTFFLNKKFVEKFPLQTELVKKYLAQTNSRLDLENDLFKQVNYLQQIIDYDLNRFTTLLAQRPENYGKTLKKSLYDANKIFTVMTPIVSKILKTNDKLKQVIKEESRLRAKVDEVYVVQNL